MVVLVKYIILKKNKISLQRPFKLKLNFNLFLHCYLHKMWSKIIALHRELNLLNPAKNIIESPGNEHLMIRFG